MRTNKNPWDISLKQRLDEITAARKAGKKVAIIIYPKKDLASSFRYRGYNIYQATKNSKKWQLVYFFIKEIDEITKIIHLVDLLIFGRITEWSPVFDELIIMAKKIGINIAHDLDDCVCGTAHIKEMFNAVALDYTDQQYWIKTSAQIEFFSNVADGFIVTNKYLGETLSETHGKKPFVVIPNFLNQEQIEFSKRIIKEKKDKFTIGYFSGSHTPATDFEVVYPEILQLLEENKNFKLRIVGMLQLPKTAQRFVKNKQIEYFKIVDFLTLQKLISETDVNIVPLAESVFTNCKSDLKFFEASLVKTPTVASPTYAFTQSIENGKNGFLCRPGEWFDTIMKLYLDKDLANKVAEKAYKYTEDHYYPEIVLEQIEAAYDAFCRK